jgi:hypothetical protein
VHIKQQDKLEREEREERRRCHKNRQSALVQPADPSPHQSAAHQRISASVVEQGFPQAHPFIHSAHQQQAIHPLLRQSVNQSINQVIYQSSNLSASQSISQSIKQSSNQQTIHTFQQCKRLQT